MQHSIAPTGILVLASYMQLGFGVDAPRVVLGVPSSELYDFNVTYACQHENEILIVGID